MAGYGPSNRRPISPQVFNRDTQKLYGGSLEDLLCWAPIFPSGCPTSFPRARCARGSGQYDAAHPLSLPLRGFAVVAFVETKRLCLFPAHAGMNPGGSRRPPVANPFPRARGDVPSSLKAPPARFCFSPRTRGCAADRTRIPCRVHLLPAHAGMHPSAVKIGVPFPALEGIKRPAWYAGHALVCNRHATETARH